MIFKILLETFSVLIMKITRGLHLDIKTGLIVWLITALMEKKNPCNIFIVSHSYSAII